MLLLCWQTNCLSLLLARHNSEPASMPSCCLHCPVPWNVLHAALHAQPWHTVSPVKAAQMARAPPMATP